MLIGLVFFFGIASFAAHKAVLASGHPMLEALPPPLRRGGGRLSLALEFVVLLTAMLLAAAGIGWAVGVYAAYGAINVVAAWLILSGRI